MFELIIKYNPGLKHNLYIDIMKNSLNDLK